MLDIKKLKELDLHGLPLYEAEVMICEELEEAWYNDEPGLLFIHGHHNGTAIRDFIRSWRGLRRKLEREFPELPGVELVCPEPGSTAVVLAQ